MTASTTQSLQQSLQQLLLPLRAEYFNAIKDGTKLEEFRLRTPFWRRRLEDRSYDRIVLTLGYPSRNDDRRRLVLPWRGVRVLTIVHEHFGAHPVEVYAIRVAPLGADGFHVKPLGL